MVGSLISGLVDAGVVHQIAQLAQPGRVGHRSGELKTSAAQVSRHRRADITAADNSETGSHGDASTVYTT